MAFVIVSCDRENDSTINSLTEETSAYEQITTKFLTSIEHEVQLGSKTTYGFWGKFWKNIVLILSEEFSFIRRLNIEKLKR